MSRWRTIQSPEERDLLDNPGIYAFYMNGVLWYIGGSAQLRRRLTGRVLDGLKVKISECRPGEVWRKREGKLLYRLRPPGNFTTGSRVLPRTQARPPRPVRRVRISKSRGPCVMIAFEMPVDQHERLSAIARGREAPMSQCIREAMRAWLATAVKKGAKKR